LRSFSSTPRRRCFAGAAEADAALVVTMLRRLPAAMSAVVAALEALAIESPSAALRFLGESPSQKDRVELVAVARGYARNDPQGALAWLHSLPVRSPIAIAAALESIAEVDPDTAAAALVDELLRVERVDIPVARVVSALMGASRSTLSGFADRLAAADDVRVRAAYQPFLTAWASNHLESASGWVLANLHRVPEASIENIVRSQAARDVAGARRLVDAFPGDLRAVGVRAGAPVLARTDFAQAVRWVATLRGQTGFSEALEALTSGVTAANVAAVTNPGSAAFAALLGDESAVLVAGLAPAAAALLARSDPAAAARWVLDLDLGTKHMGRRAAALRNVARLWASQDVAGAVDWVLSLPRGSDRDEALRTVIPQAASRGIATDRLLDAFASTANRESSLLDAVAALANTDATAAQRLIQREIADPELRKRAETRLVEGAASWPSFGSGASRLER
jgi:hypothetical protein